MDFSVSTERVQKMLTRLPTAFKNHTYTEVLDRCVRNWWPNWGGPCGGNAQGCLVPSSPTELGICVCLDGFSGKADFVDVSILPDWDLSAGESCHIDKRARLACEWVYCLTSLVCVAFNLSQNWESYSERWQELRSAKRPSVGVGPRLSKQSRAAKGQKRTLHLLLLAESCVCALESAVAMSTPEGLFYGHDLLPSFLMGLSHCLFFTATSVGVWLFIETVIATSKMSKTKSVRLLRAVSRGVFTPALTISILVGWGSWVAMTQVDAVTDRVLHRRLLTVANIAVLGMGWSALAGVIFFSYLLNQQIAQSMQWMGGTQSVSADSRRMQLVIRSCVRFVMRLTCVAVIMTVAMVGVASVWGITLYEAYISPLVLGPCARMLSLFFMLYFANPTQRQAAQAKARKLRRESRRSHSQSVNSVASSAAASSAVASSAAASSAVFASSTVVSLSTQQRLPSTLMSTLSSRGTTVVPGPLTVQSTVRTRASISSAAESSSSS